MPMRSGIYMPPLVSASRLSSPLSVSARVSISSAASQAFASCSSSSTGAFQNAMMASPMYLSMVPLRSMMALVNGVRNRFIRRVKPWVVLVVFGDGRKSAHIAEQYRHAALFAAEHQLFGRAGKLLHHVRRQVVAER